MHGFRQQLDPSWTQVLPKCHRTRHRLKPELIPLIRAKGFCNESILQPQRFGGRWFSL